MGRAMAFLPEPLVVNYAETSGTPISRLMARSFAKRQHQSGFTLNTSTDGGITIVERLRGGHISSSDSATRSLAAEATAAITFRPLVTDLIVQTAGGPGVPTLGWVLRLRRNLRFIGRRCRPRIWVAGGTQVRQCLARSGPPVYDLFVVG